MKMWCVCIYYSAIKRNKIGSFVEIWIDLESVIQTESSKSEREKQILYSNTYIETLEKWYRLTYLQGRNREADIENRHVDTVEGGNGRGGWDELGDWD